MLKWLGDFNGTWIIKTTERRKSENLNLLHLEDRFPFFREKIIWRFTRHLTKFWSPLNFEICYIDTYTATDLMSFHLIENVITKTCVWIGWPFNLLQLWLVETHGKYHVNFDLNRQKTYPRELRDRAKIESPAKIGWNFY